MSDFARLQELARGAGLAVTPPSNTAVPYVSPETAVVGAALSCTMGEWSGMDGDPATYAYQWLKDGAPVDAATGTSYTTAAPGTVSCVVTATNGAGSTAAPPSNAVPVTATAGRRAEPTHAAPAHDVHSDARRK